MDARAADTPMDDKTIETPPARWAILAVVGPSLVWAAEYIGSGEVILATRTGAIFGSSVLWAVVIGIFLKYWIAVSGARYTVCTGEGMIQCYRVGVESDCTSGSCAQRHGAEISGIAAHIPQLLRMKPLGETSYEGAFGYVLGFAIAVGLRIIATSAHVVCCRSEAGNESSELQ